MSKFNLEKSKEFVVNKQKLIAEENRNLFRKAWEDFDKIVEMLINKYNPKRIYQWGSLLEEKHFSKISDIDVAVEGVLSADEYFKMLGDVDALTEFQIDLVQIEKIEPVYAEKIKKNGRIVYERE